MLSLREFVLAAAIVTVLTAFVVDQQVLQFVLDLVRECF
jgi:hypothetical protein